MMIHTWKSSSVGRRNQRHVGVFLCTARCSHLRLKNLWSTHPSSLHVSMLCRRGGDKRGGCASEEFLPLQESAVVQFG